MKIIRLIKTLYNKLYQQTKPLKYAKKIGVNIADDFRFTGTVHWGSEPWLISVGGGPY